MARAIAGREAIRQQRIADGELVSNAPYRERLLWLLEHNVEPSLGMICERMKALGFPRFYQSPRPSKPHGDADRSFLRRSLGMWPHQSSNHHGRRYPGGYTYWIPRAMAQALYEALDMDPLWDAGERAPIRPIGDHRPHSCGAHACSEPPGHGVHGRMCEEHARFFAEIRDRYAKGGWRERQKARRRKAQIDEELEVLLLEESA